MRHCVRDMAHGRLFRRIMHGLRGFGCAVFLSAAALAKQVPFGAGGLVLFVLVRGLFLAGLKRRLKIPDPFSDSLAQLWNLIDAKDQNYDHKDDNKLRGPKMRHTLPPIGWGLTY